MLPRFSIAVWSYFQLIDFTDKSTVFRSWLLNDAGTDPALAVGALVEFYTTPGECMGVSFNGGMYILFRACLKF